jgi:hypothetical protein
MFRSQLSDYPQGSSFVLVLYQPACFVYLVCGCMLSMCMCIRCTCLCDVWSLSFKCECECILQKVHELVLSKVKVRIHLMFKLCFSIFLSFKTGSTTLFLQTWKVCVSKVLEALSFILCHCLCVFVFLSVYPQNRIYPYQRYKKLLILH